ncbi:MAG: lipid-A-disaccharide synthase [Deltaproteobacteria bacterium]|nr:lipid-A-disaccharide synthase [Deltaproteobacteria bacterium]
MSAGPASDRAGGRHVLMVAGEASGDAQGARLAAALLRADRALRLYGVGGPLMRRAGVETFVDIGELGVMGFAELGRGLGRALRLLRTVRAQLRGPARPDLFVPIDFPDFNLPLCRSAKRAGVPVFYYVSPQVWAWRRGRIRTIERAVDRMVVLFPFEAELYRGRGIDARFVGHPLAEDVRATCSPEQTRARYGLSDDRPVVVLLPGSRRREVETLLPAMLEAAARFGEAAQVAVAEAASLPQGLVPDLLGRSAPSFAGAAVAVARDDTYNLVAAADVALVTSGTATVECALLGCPMVVVYRMSPMSYALVRRLVKVPFIAMPNLLLGRRAVPELVQHEACPARMAEEVSRFLAEPEYRQRTVAALADVAAMLLRPGAATRAAELALETMR